MNACPLLLSCADNMTRRAVSVCGKTTSDQTKNHFVGGAQSTTRQVCAITCFVLNVYARVSAACCRKTIAINVFLRVTSNSRFVEFNFSIIESSNIVLQMNQWNGKMCITAQQLICWIEFHAVYANFSRDVMVKFTYKNSHRGCHLNRLNLQEFFKLEDTLGFWSCNSKASQRKSTILVKKFLTFLSLLPPQFNPTNLGKIPK